MSPKPQDVILHPLRLRILRTLGTHELTPLTLAQRMPDVAQATLYRHLKKLEEAGLIEVVKETSKRGTIEKTYRLVRGDLSPEHLAQATPEEWLQLFQRFTGSLVSDFSAYLSAAPHPLEDGVGFRQVMLYLSPEELKKMAQDLNAVITPYLSQEPNLKRRGLTLSTVLIPEPKHSDDGEDLNSN